MFLRFWAGEGGGRRVSDSFAHTGRRTKAKASNSLAVAFSVFAGRVGIPKRL